MRHVQLVVQCFWKHWMLELVPPLNRRKKRQSVRRNVKVGKVILVISVDVPHRQWFLGCAVEVVEGNDGFARVVKIQVCGIVVTHLIMKIYPLEVNQGNHNIITVCHGRGEWTGEIFALGILHEEKDIYGREWRLREWSLVFQKNNLSCLLEWN